MGVKAGDILVDVPDEDLPKLLYMYEKHKDWAPHAYSAIKTAIEWRKCDNKYLSFMSPNNCWKEDGSFFILIQYYSFDIFVFTLDETGKNVYEALLRTRRLDTSYMDRAALLYVVHHKIYPVVLKALKDKNLEVVLETPCHSYSISREEALRLNVECPPEVYIKKLDTSHASTVNKSWPHRYKNSEGFVSLLIEMNGGYGVFLKSNDELVASVVLSMMGQLSQLQTKEGHRKKGYGSLITKYVTRLLAEKGYNVFGTVLVGNTASLKMFEKIGFRDLGISTCTHFTDRQKLKMSKITSSNMLS